MTTHDQPMDHAAMDADERETRKPSDLEKNVTSRSTWLRLVFMILFALIYGLTRFVTAFVVVIQFLYVLITGNRNEQLRQFGHSLAIYSYQIVDYLTFNTETKPFPFDSVWPMSLPHEDEAVEDEDGV